MVFRTISIPLQDFTPSKLVCLATSLKQRYRDRSNILIYIFSSHEASRISMAFQEYGKETADAFAQIHALYTLDGYKQEEYVRVLPAGMRPSVVPTEGPYSTRIDLPAATTPHCHQEINNRCLIALEYINYPDEALTSGKVVLTAGITRGGVVNHVRVVKTESVPPGAERLLANAAAVNLSSWRLEPGPRQESIQITYSYSIDNSLRHVDGAQVRWALPNEVAIRFPPSSR